MILVASVLPAPDSPLMMMLWFVGLPVLVVPPEIKAVYAASATANKCGPRSPPPPLGPPPPTTTPLLLLLPGPLVLLPPLVLGLALPLLLLLLPRW